MRVQKALLLVIGIGLSSGCIPSGNADHEEEVLGGIEDLPEIGDSNAFANAQRLVATGLPPASPDSGQAHIQASFAESNVGVRIVPMKDGKGFDVLGSLGLLATITRPKPEVDEWVLDGHFTFPTSGFSLGEPFVSPMAEMTMTNQGAVMRETSDMVVITIPVRRPEVSAAVEQNEDRTHLNVRAPGSKSAEFTVVLISG